MGEGILQEEVFGELEGVLLVVEEGEAAGEAALDGAAGVEVADEGLRRVVQGVGESGHKKVLSEQRHEWKNVERKT